MDGAVKKPVNPTFRPAALKRRPASTRVLVAGPPASKREVRSTVKDRDLIAQRQHQLVQAAISVFIKKGFHRASVRDIGRAAGLTQGTIYNYIRSKNDILYLACDEMISAYQTAVFRAMAEVDDPLLRLREAVRATTEVIATHQEYILLVYRSSHELDKKSRRAIVSRIAAHIDAFERLVVAATQDRVLPHQTCRLIANIFTFLPTMFALRRWDLKRVPFAEGEAADLLVEFMIGSLASGFPAHPKTASQAAKDIRTNKATVREVQNENEKSAESYGRRRGPVSAPR